MFSVQKIAAAIAVGSMLVLATAVPASAHDDLVGSTPAVDEKLAVAPTEVSLSFSDAVLPMGAAVIVVDAAGRDWVTGEPGLTGATVTAELEAGMPDAGYELRWRVVSADGHPISGLVPFTVGAGEPLTRTPAESAGRADAPNTTDAQAQSADDDRGPGRILLIGAGGAGVALAALLLVSFLRRRNAAAAQPGGTDGAER